MIELRAATKRYGPTVAVDRLSFTVRPGHVTGFLGPNGAGKSTTMRLILGLDAPTSGMATINGVAYHDLPAPLAAVGSLLDARAVHPGRTARNHLRWLARSNSLPAGRVDEVLAMAGLEKAADRRAGGFSLGMSQRLGIAAALLGDPPVLLFDEPVNGLDTEGIRWIRGLMKRLADEGRTVFLSSHLMSEMELTADRLIVIGRGRLLADTTVADFIEQHSQPAALVRSPRSGELRIALERADAQVEADASGGWRVAGLRPATIGDIAANQGIPIHELRPIRSSLEDVYSNLVDTSVQYRGGSATPTDALEGAPR